MKKYFICIILTVLIMLGFFYLIQPEPKSIEIKSIDTITVTKIDTITIQKPVYKYIKSINDSIRYKDSVVTIDVVRLNDSTMAVKPIEYFIPKTIQTITKTVSQERLQTYGVGVWVTGNEEGLNAGICGEYWIDKNKKISVGYGTNQTVLLGFSYTF